MGDLGGPQRPESQGPAAIWLLAEFVCHPLVAQLLLVLACAFVSRGALKRRVKAVAAVIDRPDRQTVGDWAGGKRLQIIWTHRIAIGSRRARLDWLSAGVSRALSRGRQAAARSSSTSTLTAPWASS